MEWPRLVSSLVGRWIAIVLVASIVALVDGGWVTSWAALEPDRIVAGEVWRLVTWSFVEVRPITLLVTCIAIFKFGGELAVVWGDRRLLRFVAQIVLAAGVLTCVLALVVGATDLYRIGGWAVMDILVIAWARQYPTRTLVFYGMVEVRGRNVIVLTAAATFLIALAAGDLFFVPEVIACGVTILYPRRWLSRGLRGS